MWHGVHKYCAMVCGAPIVLDTFLDVLKDEVGYENWDWVGPRGSCPLLPTTAALE